MEAREQADFKRRPSLDELRNKPLEQQPLLERPVSDGELPEPPAAVFTLGSPEETSNKDILCPHGVVREPLTPDAKDAVVCLLCQEAMDDVANLTSRNPSTRNRRLTRTSNVSVMDLESGEQEEGDTRLQGAMGDTRSEGSQSKSLHGSVDNVSMHKSHSCQETSSDGLSFGQQTQDLRRTQSLKSLFCLPEDDLPKHDRRLRQAHQCPRVSTRRNALNDPFKMTMPQETRERIQRETQERKTSVKKRVSKYFKSLVEDEPEVDLI